MASPTEDLLATLTTLTVSLTNTLTSLPSPSDSASITPPKNGISLLDVKNDVLLSYLHNLVFLALLRLRSIPVSGHATIDDLVKLRVLLERGVKPLEQRLKYQIDKVVVAAAETHDVTTATREKKSHGKKRTTGTEEFSSGNEFSGDESDSSAEDEGHDVLRTALGAPSDLVHRPNPASLLLKPSKIPATTKPDVADGGLYKPPRIAATVMPDSAVREKKERAPVRNHALEDFVADELAVAPRAVPSIGSTIVQQGRAHKSARDTKREQERQEFEEANLVRLPKQSKKDAQAMRKQNRGERENAFGGEDWRSFAGDLDKLTKNAGRLGRGEKVLDRSRKRGRDEGEGRGIGKHYEGRKGMLDKRRKT